MVEGVIRKAPKTRSDGGMEGEDGQSHRCGELAREDFPPLTQLGGIRSHSPPPSAAQNSNPRIGGDLGVKPTPNFQTHIDKFVGYFRQQKPSKRRTYAQPVRFEQEQVLMAPPGRGAGRGGGRVLGAGREGRGARCTDARTFVWQRTGRKGEFEEEGYEAEKKSSEVHYQEDHRFEEEGEIGGQENKGEEYHKATGSSTN
jgi:hypothetical protein